MVVTKPREAPRFLNTMAKKKSEPAERIRQLMESLQGGGGKKEQKTYTFTERQSTSTPAESPSPSSTMMAAADESRLEREASERRRRELSRAHMSNDGMQVIDDEPEGEEEEVCERDRESLLLARQDLKNTVLANLVLLRPVRAPSVHRTFTERNSRQSDVPHCG